MSLNFNNIYPWSQIKDVTVDGQAMVWIPRFYIKTGSFTSGTYSGKMYWYISGKKLSGYRIHPAFTYCGAEKNGFYIAKYLAKEVNGVPTSQANVEPTNIGHINNNADSIHNRCTLRNDGSNSGAKAGWHLRNCFEFAAIEFLYLIENASTDTASIWSGQSNVTGGTNAKYRGICDLNVLGGNRYGEIVDGIDENGSYSYEIFTTNGMRNKIRPGNDNFQRGNGYISVFSDYVNGDLNLADFFFGKTLTSDKNQALMHAYFNSDVAYEHATAATGQNNELFSLVQSGNHASSGKTMYYRLAKYDL